jgi:hypothetical protein
MKRWHSKNHSRVCLQGNYIKAVADNYTQCLEEYVQLPL